MQLRGLAITVALLAHGCEIPCDDVACEGALVCVDGACSVGIIPIVEVISPRESVDDASFDVEVDVQFSSATAITRLRLVDGDRCVPFFERSVVVDGPSPQRVVFEDVPAAGADFAYEVEVEAQRVVTRTLRLTGPPGEELIALEVIDPPLSLEEPLGYVPLTLESEVPFAEWTVTVRPADGDPTPTLSLARQTDAVNAFVPSALGPQIVDVRTDTGLRCEIGVEQPRPGEGLSLGLGFLEPDGVDLDLIVVMETDDGIASCSAKSPVGCDASTDQGFTSIGFEEVITRAGEGVFGLAVRRAAISDGPEAFVRVTHDGVHQGFLGPSRLNTEVGNVWLAGRVFVFSGEVFVEPIDTEEATVPERPPSAW